MAEGRGAAPHDGDGRGDDARRSSARTSSAWPTRGSRGWGSGSGSPTRRCRGRSSRPPTGAGSRCSRCRTRCRSSRSPRRCSRGSSPSSTTCLQRAVDAEHVLTRAVMDGRRRRGDRRVARARDEGWALLLDLHGIPLAATSRAATRAGRTDLGGAPRLAARRHGLQPVARRRGPPRLGAAGRRAGSGRGVPRGRASPSRRRSSTGSSPGTRCRCSRSSWRSPAPSRTPSAASRGTSSTSWRQDRCSEADAARGLARFGFARDAHVRGGGARGRRRRHARTSGRGPPLPGGRRLPGLASRRRRGDPAPRRRGAGGRGAAEGDRRSGSASRSAVGSGQQRASGEVGRSLREARYALQVCRLEGWTFAGFEDLGTYRLLLSMAEPDALRAFADSLLAPLDAYDRRPARGAAAVAPGVPPAQRPMGDGVGGAVRAPAHAAVPDAQGRGAHRPRPVQLASTGWSSGWPSARARS